MDIFNWDMVCAASCLELNNMLKTASREAFGDFSWSNGEGNYISGSFDGWEIVAGGDAQRINIITPVSTGRLEATVLGKPVDVSVDGLCPSLQVELAFVNAGGGDSSTHLKFNLARVDKKETAGDGSVVVLSPDTTRLFPDAEAIIPEIYSNVMAEMLVAKRDEISFIFAEVMDIPDASEVSWMKPHLLTYAYNEKLSGELGCLAVLVTLDDAADDGANPFIPPLNRPIPDQRIFDSALIREGGSIGFMLSRRMFMTHVVRPGLPGVIKGSNLNQYYVDDSDVIRHFLLVSLSKINGYTPYFTHFEMAIIDNRVVINNTSGLCEVGKDRSYNTFELSGTYVPELSVSEGKYHVMLNKADGPSLSIEIHDTLAKWLWIFGGKLVDELLHQIKDEMSKLLFEFSTKMSFDFFPIMFNTNTGYCRCGLADNFYMQD